MCHTFIFSTPHSLSKRIEFVNRVHAGLIAILCFLLGPALFSQEKQFPLTMENLTTAKLPIPMMLGSGSIEFKRAGAYAGGLTSEGIAWYDEGKFAIRDGQVELKPEKCFYHQDTDVTDCDQSLGHAFCKIEPSPNDPYYAYRLRCTSEKNRKFFGTDNIVFVFPQTAVPIGTLKIFKGIRIIVIGAIGTTTTGVKIREAPSPDADAIEYRPEIYPGAPPWKPFVPSGVKVSVVARTEAKQKIGNWLNYWYLVNVGANREVWMFAEFVKLDN